MDVNEFSQYALIDVIVSYQACFLKVAATIWQMVWKLSPHSWRSDISFPESGMSNQIIRNYGIVQYCF